MAAPQCMSEDGSEAVFVGTMLQTGDSVALCDECLVAWAAALLNVMTGVDPQPFLRAVSTDAEDLSEADAFHMDPATTQPGEDQEEDQGPSASTDVDEDPPSHTPERRRRPRSGPGPAVTSAPVGADGEGVGEPEETTPPQADAA